MKHPNKATIMSSNRRINRLLHHAVHLRTTHLYYWSDYCKAGFQIAVII